VDHQYLEEIEREALAQLAADARRVAVSQAVQRMKNRRTLWARIRDTLPFTITITRKKNHDPH
jgi:hypothetical protein